MTLKVIEERDISKRVRLKTLRIFGDLVGTNVWELTKVLERNAIAQARRLHIVIEDAAHMSAYALGQLVRAKLQAEAWGLSRRITIKTSPPILTEWPELWKYFDQDDDRDDPTGVHAKLIPPSPSPLAAGETIDPDGMGVSP